jgi:predicted dehydrogenase
MKRRIFLTGAALAPAVAAAANDRVRVGLIGAGGRGRLLTGEFKEVGAEVAGVCDVYQPHLDAGLKEASTGAKAYKDYRRMLEDKSLDGVIVATPDHWHARMVIDAVQAGKDVYVEKPLCHNVDEGFEMVDAVRKNKRICQVGTQRRSMPLFYEVKDIVRSGKLGEIRLVTSLWLNHQSGLRQRNLQGELDWKAWLGPAPNRELDPMRFYNWYYYWDYSGGLLIGQGAHMIDAIQWLMGSDAPVAVTCAGGDVNLKPAEITETASTALEYGENFLATFTIGYKAMRYHTHNDQLAQYHGSKARLDVGRESYSLWPEQPTLTMKPDVTKAEPKSFDAATRQHIRNFLECVKTRSEPNAPVEAGLQTAIALCMTVDSLRAKRRVRWNASARKIEA